MGNADFDFIISNGDDAIVLAADSANATSFNVWRIFDSDGTTGTIAAFELLGSVTIADGNFSGLLLNSNFIA